ncbi:MAG: hypothetical protein K6G81_08065 [Lachnospiraceae bacterium]|nr:hypothetical protein [Lachnospiraceae bacterium]
MDSIKTISFGEAGQIKMARTGALVDRKFTQFLIPTILMSMALQLGTIVDGIICAQFIGTDALAAINLCAPVILAFGAIYSILGVGGSTVVSTCLGQRDKDKADRVYTLGLFLLLTVGVLVMLLGFFLAPAVAHFIAAGSSMEDLVYKYVSIYFYGAPAFFLVPGLAYYVRADGNPTVSALILIIANVVNLSCDVIYIIVFGLGIRGAALASCTGYVAGFFVAFAYFFSSKRTLKFKFPGGGTLSFIKEILSTGLPSALNSVLMFVKMYVLNKVALNTLGDAGATVIALCNNCLSFAAIFIGGAAQTMLPLMAMLNGENDNPGVMFTLKKAVKVVLEASCVMLIIFELFTTSVAMLFGVSLADIELMEVSRLAIHLFGLSLPIFGINYLLMCFYQATGHKALAIVATVAQGLLFIVPLVLILSKVFPYRGIGIWISFVIAECLTMATVFVVGKITAAKQGADNIWLLKSSDEFKELDISINVKTEEISAVSECIQDFCSQNGASDYIATVTGLSAEELVYNTLQNGYGKQTGKKLAQNSVDINIKIFDEEVVMRIRDDGKPCNPLECDRDDGKADDPTDSINIVKKISSSVEYERTMGMNNLIVKYKKGELNAHGAAKAVTA